MDWVFPVAKARPVGACVYGLLATCGAIPYLGTEVV